MNQFTTSDSSPTFNATATTSPRPDLTQLAQQSAHHPTWLTPVVLLLLVIILSIIGLALCCRFHEKYSCRSRTRRPSVPEVATPSTVKSGIKTDSRKEARQRDLNLNINLNPAASTSAAPRSNLSNTKRVTGLGIPLAPNWSDPIDAPPPRYGLHHLN